MIYVISVATVITCFLLANLTLDQNKLKKISLLRPRIPDEGAGGKQLKQAHIRLFSGFIAIGAAVTVWRLSITGYGAFNTLKLSIALICLTGSACVDYIEHRIPNIFPLVLAVGAAAMLTIGCVTKQEGAIGYVMSSVFAAAVSAACLIIGSFLSHNGIGMGDIKLITALALMGGVYTVGGTLFFAMTMCALVSCYLLITKKKTIKGSIPFGPFILLGYMLTICASIF